MSGDKMSGQAMPNVQYVGPQPPPPPYSTHPPPGVQPPPGAAIGTVTTTFIVTNPAGPDPMITTCPSCHHQIVTRTERNPTTKTHAIACLLFWFICWPCVCLPYCMDSCNNIDHYCPNCNAYIGGYKF
ncbi:lipopolysaccharide-induced tumor necrosis factor-alpha factor homolog [Amyelois transitella]|uniref:lipopolysaccharide-induced tumor necrosis factor-alpha factor homolog n=1 Tax=Amyelois transitella TaxID=680683 RepID=UPI00298F3EBC|nr:lipopolysaccharide-induced tumor necrosis factor-alpha factor homolog [Amyelois transitella]